ncbi:MAG: ATP-binding protein [Gemmatimonadota bacterium]
MSFGSLERKLPILIGGLVAFAVLAALLLVRHELRQSAIRTAGERLSMVTAQLDDFVETTVATRGRFAGQVAADPLLADYASGAPADLGAIDSTLDRLRIASDSGLPIQLQTTAGQVLAATGAPGAADGAGPPAPRARPIRGTDADTIAYSDLQAQGGRATFWMTVPVRRGDTLIAHVAQQRGIGGGSAGEQIEQLIGGSAEIYFTNASGGVWTSLTGELREDLPPVPATLEPFAYADSAGEQRLAYAEPIAGTPWLIVTQMPMTAVLARSNQLLRRLGVIAAVLLLFGGVGAWLIGRSVTAPLRRLGAAADSIAAGDYTQRTRLVRDDEIGRVAHSFDTMAAQFQATHAEIGRRYEQAQQLAAELERANARLTEAIRDADAARTEAQQASHAKSEFLATMSHEIRTPINAVVGYTDLMEMGLPGPLTAKQREYILRIRRSGELLTSVVNDVLDFAKIESGQMRIQQEPGMLAREIGDAVSLLKGRAAARRITVHVACEERYRYIGDAQRVQQILLNLLSNAIKFTEEGGSVSIDCDRRESSAPPALAARPRSTWSCVTVADNGVGIAADQFEHIFEPFVQGAGGYTRPHGGTGLGLAISRSLARMMDGDITVESRPGEGSRFTVWLPHA